MPFIGPLQDLRQDERVMQLFGLVNNMLAGDATTAERDLSIARYAVIPLSPNSGLIGYAECDGLIAHEPGYRQAPSLSAVHLSGSRAHGRGHIHLCIVGLQFLARGTHDWYLACF
jgi:hypothetical protein